MPRTIDTLLERRWLAILARILLTLPYWSSAILKLFDFPGAVGEVAHFGVPAPAIVAIIVIVVQLLGSIAVISRRASWLGAGALGVFTAIATLLAHRFWTIDAPLERFMTMNTFFEHIALIGGLMLAAVLDHRERKLR